MKQGISFLAALLLLLTVIACAKTPGDTVGTGTAADSMTQVQTESDTDAVSETQEEAPQIPDTVKGNGSDFVVYSQGWWGYTPLDVTDVGIAEGGSDSFSDAAYRRDREIEYRLDINMVYRSETECYDSFTKLQNEVTAGVNDIDLALLRSAVFTSAISSGILENIDEGSYPYFDPTKSWWNSASYDALSVMNTHYGVCGDFTVSDDLTVWALFFNKQMIADNQLASPYDMVRNGTWTYDELFRMAAVAAKDIDGVEGRTYEDCYGVSYLRDTVSGMINSIGISVGGKDDDDIPYISFYNESDVTKILSLFEKLYDTDVCYNIHARGGDEVAIFTDGRALFTFGGMYYAPQMRAAEQIEFGIIPYPKYSAEQKSYISSTSPLFLTVLCVPKQGSDRSEMIGAFMEEYSYLGNQTVIPEFYDKLVMWKLTRDDESREMLPYIFDNTTYDVCNIFNFGDMAFRLIDMTMTNDTDIASMYASYEEAAKEAIRNLITAIK